MSDTLIIVCLPPMTNEMHHRLPHVSARIPRGRIQGWVEESRRSSAMNH